jgi:hypothetical protein
MRDWESKEWEKREYFFARLRRPMNHIYFFVGVYKGRKKCLSCSIFSPSTWWMILFSKCELNALIVTLYVQSFWNIHDSVSTRWSPLKGIIVVSLDCNLSYFNSVYPTHILKKLSCKLWRNFLLKNISQTSLKTWHFNNF